jgi:Transposase DDE domain
LTVADQTAEWAVRIPLPDPQRPLAVRLCAVRKSAGAIALAQAKLRRKARKPGWRGPPESLLYAEYVMVLSTFPAPYSAPQVLEAYRLRWQVELVFKRLKQIAQLGHLPKHDPESSQAWLYGKLLVALLTEKVMQAAHALSPWGYELRVEQGAQPRA